MKMYRILAIAVVALAALIPATAARAAAEPGKIDFTERTLDNGLHVILVPLRQAPVVHVRVLYHVGSRDERPDRQGFAHMFEHMMFRGSAHVAPEEHMKRIGVVGGISNAFTSFDQTVYVNTVPAQYLDMALWLEADRMASFKVSDEIFQTERKVVAEEWRMRMNRPYGSMYEDFLKNVFTKHSYRWTPIGDMDQLRQATSNELQEFFNTYYVPNNATLVIAGDFDPKQADELVNKYYNWIPKGPQPPRNIPAEPKQTEARNVVVPQRVPLPAVVVGWHAPEYQSDDHYALNVLDTILGDGQSSRLYRQLVGSDKPLAVSASGMHLQLEDNGIFGVTATVMQGKDPQQVQDILKQAVADVLEKGVTAEEVAKAKSILRVGIINGRETATDLADQVGEEYLFGGDAQRVNTALAKLDAITPEVLQQVAKKYLQPNQSTTMLIKPDPTGTIAMKQAATQAAALKDAPVKPATAPVEPRVALSQFPKDYPKQAPTADPRKSPEFAKGVETTVNGVKVIVMPDNRLPLVNWSVTMRRGSQSDPKGKEGLNWLTSEMLRRGVEGMTFNELTQDLDSRAITITVGDGGDYTRLSGHATTEQLEHGITRSRQILRTPTFPAEEFEKLKEQSVNSLQLAQESPGTVAGNDLTTALFGDTPLGRYATPKSVMAIMLDDVKRFYQQIYKPNDAILILSGDVTVEKGQALAAKLLADWSPGELPAVEIKLPPPSQRRRIILVDRPEGKQATVRMGVPAYTVRSDEKFPGSIASRILSSGIDSRLGKYVRAQKGLAYGVRGMFNPNRKAGDFTGSTDTAVESTADAVEAMFKVFDDMRRENVTDTELAEAKMRTAGGMVMAVQTIAEQAGYRVDGILNDYPIDYYDKYAQRIGEVAADEVREVMNKYVKDDAMTIVVVAPAEQVKKQLERIAPVEVVPMPAKRDGAAAATTKPSDELLKKAA
ncbi:MAG: zinc protease [Phycisphaerales bacterium]|jgi:zinc protease|nr:zinc protease [Phycisphaerales bacterium]